MNFLPLSKFGLSPLRIVGFFFVLLLLMLPHTAAAQEDNSDNVLWSSLQLRKSVKDWSFQLQPIFRFNQDLGAYSNSSFDYSARKKFGAHWYGQVMGRTWFMPDRSDRQFIWLDLGHSIKIPTLSLSMTNRVRWHMALDVNDVFDADFIRYSILFVPTTSWKVKPAFAFEPWYQLNGFNSVRRIRFEPSIRATLSDQLGLTFIWRRQHDINRELHRRDNLWVVALVIKL